MAKEKTIAAIATPIGAGGIGIIKISGDDAVNIARRIFREKRRIPFSKERLPFGEGKTIQTHRLYYGHIVDPDTEQIIDEVLLSVMAAPHSYTREDVVEINAHSGILVLKKILSLILEQGGSLAEPGEFTKRAYLNGRIDLTQAEAVMDIVNAKSDRALELASAQLEGKLGMRIKAIRSKLEILQAEIEAGIEFPEDVEEEADADIRMIEGLTNIQAEISMLIAGYNSGHMMREGFKVSIVGKPNVGKSSLMNCFVEKERVIVTAKPGTTRDIIEETLILDGLPIVVSDTAGLHYTTDPVESIGVEKTRENVREANLVLFMVEAGSSLTEEDQAVYNQIKSKEKILVINKIDRISCPEDAVKIPEEWESMGKAYISALFRDGIDGLKRKMVNICNNVYLPAKTEGLVPNLRQVTALKKGLDAIQEAVSGFRNSTPSDLLTLDIKRAIDAMDETLGLTSKGDVLDKVFALFCVGK